MQTPTLSENIILDVDIVIKEFDQEWTYVYLGGKEGNGIQYSKIKEGNQNEVHPTSARNNENWI